MIFDPYRKQSEIEIEQNKFGYKLQPEYQWERARGIKINSRSQQAAAGSVAQ